LYVSVAPFACSFHRFYSYPFFPFFLSSDAFFFDKQKRAETFDLTKLDALSKSPKKQTDSKIDKYLR
jgi:hypothetical protein